MSEPDAYGPRAFEVHVYERPPDLPLRTGVVESGGEIRLFASKQHHLDGWIYRGAYMMTRSDIHSASPWS